MPYGDQAIFLRVRVFQEMRGFPELLIMEDFEFIRRLQQRGSITLVDTPVVTSARHWLQNGIVQTSLINRL
jgi:hypothetical protein